MPTMVTVEVDFEKFTMVRGIYTAWNVTKIMYAMEKDQQMLVPLNHTYYSLGLDKDDKTGIQMLLRSCQKLH